MAITDHFFTPDAILRWAADAFIAPSTFARMQEKDVAEIVLHTNNAALVVNKSQGKPPVLRGMIVSPRQTSINPRSVPRIFEKARLNETSRKMQQDGSIFHARGVLYIPAKYLQELGLEDSLNGILAQKEGLGQKSLGYAEGRAISDYHASLKSDGRAMSPSYAEFLDNLTQRNSIVRRQVDLFGLGNFLQLQGGVSEDGAVTLSAADLKSYFGALAAGGDSDDPWVEIKIAQNKQNDPLFISAHSRLVSELRRNQPPRVTLDDFARAAQAGGKIGTRLVTGTGKGDIAVTDSREAVRVSTEALRQLSEARKILREAENRLTAALPLFQVDEP